jgi:hypothetical protein
LAPIQPAGFLQNRADHPASLFRMAMAGQLSGGPTIVGATSPAGGVHPALGGRLAATGQASMNVSIATGLVYMPCSTAWNGLYSGYNSAAYTVAITAASATQWRTDLIVARQHDTALGDADNNWDIIAVAGTLSGSAPGATPAAPSNSIPLALVRVVPNMTVTNGGGTVVDARQFIGLSGPIFCTSATRPALTSPEGTMWVETDTHLIGVILNGAYSYIPTSPSSTPAAGPWTAFNPLSNTWAVRAPYTSAWVRKLNFPPNCVQISATMTTGTSAPNIADGTVIGVIPAGFRPATAQVLPLSVGANFGQAWVNIAAGGNMTCNAVGVQNALANVNGIYPLDSL